MRLRTVAAEKHVIVLITLRREYNPSIHVSLMVFESTFRDRRRGPGNNITHEANDVCR